MKRVIIAIIILSIIVIAGILEAIFIDNMFDKIEYDLDEITIKVAAQDEHSLEAVNELSVWWEQKRTHIELFAYSPDLKTFSVALAETKGSLECGDFENALSKCESLKIIAANLHSVLDFNATDII